MRIRFLILSLALSLVYPLTAATQPDTFQIVGAVRDRAGHPAADATVRLQSQGADRADQHRTGSTGEFAFSGLKPGTYVITATRLDQRSPAASVQGSAGTVQRVELTLETAAAGTGNATDMQFSDTPNFTVAAVTDWTAAGGHGSDVSLRTSESLTRDTLRLKAEPNGSASHDTDATERRLKQVLAQSPQDVNANAGLGRFYLNAGRYTDAVPPLAAAYALDPSNQANEYALALALVRSGDPGQAREHLDRLLAGNDRPEYHRLAGELEEKLGDSLAAVRAFEQAVKQDPSEENYFAWGTELLAHRAIWQARDVLEAGIKAHPHSTRLLTALGTALFSGALYEQAAERLCQASDLSPNDPEPYLFMGKVEIAAPNPLPCVETRLKRFVDQQPANALANYYYAMAYWKQHGKTTDPDTFTQVQALLDKAVRADPQCSSAYLQLGILQASRSDYQQASGFYRKAIAADALSTEAHYRLGVAYDRLGEKDKAAEEFRLHDELEKQQAAAVDRQRREVKQFLVQVGEQDKPAQP
ncbi:MAG TPA: tetratricopeptide repeat protein [Terracidiphilus sp.]